MPNSRRVARVTQESHTPPPQLLRPIPAEGHAGKLESEKQPVFSPQPRRFSQKVARVTQESQRPLSLLLHIDQHIRQYLQQIAMMPIEGRMDYAMATSCLKCYTRCPFQKNCFYKPEAISTNIIPAIFGISGFFPW